VLFLLWCEYRAAGSSAGSTTPFQELLCLVPNLEAQLQQQLRTALAAEREGTHWAHELQLAMTDMQRRQQLGALFVRSLFSSSKRTLMF
jgi:hypothetical protein